MEDITVGNIRQCGKTDYHDFNVQRNKYLVADPFLRFQDICLKIYEFNPCPFFTASGLT